MNRYPKMATALSSMHRVDVIRELELHWGEEAPKSYTVDMLKSVLKQLRKEAEAALDPLRLEAIEKAGTLAATEK